MVKNRKAEGEFSFLLLLVVFIAIMGIFNTIFDEEIKQEIPQDTEDDTFWDYIKNLFSGISNLIENIPIFGDFWSFVNTSFQFVYVHEYLRILLAALFGIPLGYIALRLVRGGG